jgi:hypothetical protein
MSDMKNLENICNTKLGFGSSDTGAETNEEEWETVRLLT